MLKQNTYICKTKNLIQHNERFIKKFENKEPEIVLIGKILKQMQKDGQ